MSRNWISQEEINALLTGTPLPKSDSDRENPPTISKLHNWFLEKSEYNAVTEYIARGNVTGHDYLIDTDFIHTSLIKKIELDLKTEEVIITTKNTEYHCRLSECDYEKGDTFDRIPKLKQLAIEYGAKPVYDTDENSILIVLSDHYQYYFEAVLVKVDGVIYEGKMKPHIGTLQDSCLLCFKEYCNTTESIDLRYFPHHKHLSFYGWDIAGMDIYLENQGEREIFVTTPAGVIKLEPNNKKLVSTENAMAEEDTPLLDTSDLYPMLEC